MEGTRDALFTLFPTNPAEGCRLMVSALAEHVTRCGGHLGEAELVRVRKMIKDGVRATEFVERATSLRDIGMKAVMARLGDDESEFEWMLYAACRPRTMSAHEYAQQVYGVGGEYGVARDGSLVVEVPEGG